MRSYQDIVFKDNSTGILVLHWSRQIGKSYTLAYWAVWRLIRKLREHPDWLITVLSNSRDNGAEFCRKAAEACRWAKAAYEERKDPAAADFASMRMEIRVTLIVGGKEHSGRIKVLAANPRTARGFSGDLILDEFAFHENSHAIWEAAEPILSANAEYLCRIASTGNGRHNLFHRLAAGPGPDNGKIFKSTGGFAVSRVTRTEAAEMGVAIYDPHTRQNVSPEQARAAALDKRAYDQNYECRFNDENMCLLTHGLVQQAERGGPAIDCQEWSQATLARLAQTEGPLYLGGDIGRRCDLTVFAVVERAGAVRRVLAMLRLAGLRLPRQQAQLDLICALPKFRRACLDMTGLGLGLVEYAQERHGVDRVQGVNFATTEPVNSRLRAEGRRAATARVTELMATDLLAAFEERSLEIHVELDHEAREDLRKPEKMTTPGGRVSIAAVRDEAGHADHFWALALALRAADAPESGRVMVFENTRSSRALAGRRDRVVEGLG